jgi:hypothetical protein
MAPDSRLASIAAVFSIARTTMRRRCGFSPYQFGLGSSTMCEPADTCVMRNGPL